VLYYKLKNHKNINSKFGSGSKVGYENLIMIRKWYFSKWPF